MFGVKIAGQHESRELVYPRPDDSRETGTCFDHAVVESNLASVFPANSELQIVLEMGFT